MGAASRNEKGVRAALRNVKVVGAASRNEKGVGAVAKNKNVAYRICGARMSFYFASRNLAWSLSAVN